MKFQFNHTLKIIRDLPRFQRRPKLIAVLVALCSPLNTIYSQFLQLQQKLNKEANYNSQVGVLEWLLNQTFDSSLRRIRILDSESFATPIRAYLRAEARPRLAAYLRSEGEEKMKVGKREEYNTDDFLVEIPTELNASQTPIRRLVNKYKMGGKSFSIINP